MRPPLWERIKQTACRWFGHREGQDSYVVFCKRCGRVLRSRVLPSERTDDE